MGKTKIRKLMAEVNGNPSSGRIAESYRPDNAVQSSGAIPGTLGRRVLSSEFEALVRDSVPKGKRGGLVGYCPKIFALKYTGTIHSVNGMLDKIFSQSPDAADFASDKAYGLIGEIGHWRNSHRRVIGAYLTSFVLVDDLDKAEQIPKDFDRLRAEQRIVEEIADPGAESNGRGYLQVALFSLPLHLRTINPDEVAESLHDRFAQMPIELDILSELHDQQTLNHPQ